MQNKNMKNVLLLILCVAATFVGIYMTFFHQAADDDIPYINNVGQDKEAEMEEYVETQTEEVSLPDYENESSNETYTDGTEITVYFENTDVIDQGSLPLGAHSILCSSAQKFLKRSGYGDVTELYVDEESYTEDDKKITFHCFMDGYEEQLGITYDVSEQMLRFNIIEE